MKDFQQQKTDSPQDTAFGIVKPKGRGHPEGRDSAQANPAADALRAPGLSRPANAAPLADLLGQLQQSHGNVYVQRVVSEMNETKSGAESHATDGGQSLDGGIRTEMESAFGENFGEVRVHIGGDAERMNEELGSRAVTRGRDVYFGRGEYDPSTRDGREVLAHELTHVIQQRGSSSSHQANSMGQVGDAFEQEADHAAASVLIGQRAHVANRAAAPASQRQSRGEPQRIRQMETYEAEHLGEAIWDGLTLRFLFTKGITVDTFHITVPAGVGVAVVDLSGMNIQVRDPGGTGRRPIIIVASRQVQGPRLLQVTFIKGNTIYVATFAFPAMSAAAKSTAQPPGAH